MTRSSRRGVCCGVGDCISNCEKNGALCGSGEMSIHSFIGPGEDEGRGGVVTFSILCQLHSAIRSFMILLLTPAINCSE